MERPEASLERFRQFVHGDGPTILAYIIWVEAERDQAIKQTEDLAEALERIATATRPDRPWLMTIARQALAAYREQQGKRE